MISIVRLYAYNSIITNNRTNETGTINWNRSNENYIRTRETKRFNSRSLVVRYTDRYVFSIMRPKWNFPGRSELITYQCFPRCQRGLLRASNELLRDFTLSAAICMVNCTADALISIVQWAPVTANTYEHIIFTIIDTTTLRALVIL